MAPSRWSRSNNLSIHRTPISNGRGPNSPTLPTAPIHYTVGKLVVARTIFRIWKGIHVASEELPEQVEDDSAIVDGEHVLLGSVDGQVQSFHCRPASSRSARTVRRMGLELVDRVRLHPEDGAEVSVHVRT